jgi:hypothetical protein
MNEDVPHNTQPEVKTCTNADMSISKLFPPTIDTYKICPVAVLQLFWPPIARKFGSGQNVLPFLTRRGLCVGQCVFACFHLRGYINPLKTKRICFI